MWCGAVWRGMAWHTRARGIASFLRGRDNRSEVGSTERERERESSRVEKFSRENEKWSRAFSRTKTDTAFLLSPPE